MVEKSHPRPQRPRKPRGRPLTVPEAVGWALELLHTGFAVSALNVLMEDTKQVARATLVPLETAPRPPAAARAVLAKALTVAIDRLQEMREAVKGRRGGRSPKVRRRPPGGARAAVAQGGRS